MPEKRARLALTIGDPAGIGPEISARLLEKGELDKADIRLIGSAEALFRELEPGIAGKLEVLSVREAESGKEPSSFPVIIDVAGDTVVPMGGPCGEGGRISGKAIEAAVRLAKKGTVDGIVTGPVSKEALNRGGYFYKGHTAMLSDLMDAPDCQMLMVSGALRILILTRDIPLANVPEKITEELIRTGTKVTVRALREFFGIDAPRILVAALNPHAGDGGINGAEEADTILPAVESLRSEGIDVEGPIPADTLFHDWWKKGVDAFIALYHDQGMIPFKMNGFENGVNMTIGLPVVRTSVCHGTAYDIVGKRIADPGSLSAAVALATGCLTNRKKKIGI